MTSLSPPTAQQIVHRLDALAGQISTSLLGVDSDDLDAAFERTLQLIVETLEAERGILLEFIDADPTFGVVASWPRRSREHAESEGDRAAKTASFIRLLRDDPVRLVRIPEDCPPEAAGGELDGVPAGSALGVPVRVGGRRVGALVIVSPRDAGCWDDQTVGRVQLLAEILACAIHRRLQTRALRSREMELTQLSTQRESEALYLREELQTLGGFDDIVGDSPVLREALDRVREVASTDASVLLLGETGTGKELFARAVHDRSSRRHRPLVRVNCAALPPTLIESELFGHERGAFTGAVAMRLGRFELADKGTIFLDEIGDLPLELQAKLLRVLQDGEFERVGSSQTRKVDVRVIAATHRSLAAAAESHEFRADLYYRLSVYPIHVPALRERLDDIPRLVWFFVHRRQRALHRQIRRIPQSVMEALRHYSWPGNVRELENVIERAMIRSPGDTLVLDSSLGPAARGLARAHADSLETVERRHIEDVLRRCGWRINGRGNAAEHLNLHPNTLRFRMKKLGISRPTRSADAPPRASAG
jgi:transcriptional regulator with GAF, ATPase, and Fis domain